MSTYHHEKSPISSYIDELPPFEKVLFIIYIFVILLGAFGKLDPVSHVNPEPESTAANAEYINVNLDLSFVSQVLQKPDLTIEDCFRVYFDLPDNVPLTEEHMLLIRDITIKEVVAGEVRSSTFSDGLQMYLQFRGTLNQGDAMRFKLYPESTRPKNPATYFEPHRFGPHTFFGLHLEFNDHNA